MNDRLLLFKDRLFAPEFVNYLKEMSVVKTCEVKFYDSYDFVVQIKFPNRLQINFTRLPYKEDSWLELSDEENIYLRSLGVKDLILLEYRNELRKETETILNYIFKKNNGYISYDTELSIESVKEVDDTYKFNLE